MANPYRNGDDKVHYTASEEKILALLADGNRHKTDEVLATLGDPFLEKLSMQQHISHIRPKLRLKGQDIICELYKGGLYYRQVRLLLSVNSGRSE